MGITQGGSVMGINLQAKTDYSFLFSGMGTTGTYGSGTSSWLSDYASIKNGSYGKLMKAYYGKNSSDSVKKMAQNTEVNRNQKTALSETAKAYTKVQSTTDALKESADALLAKGKDSLFAKDRQDQDKIYSAVNAFVQDYNQVLSAADDVDNNTIANRVDSMVNTTSVNAKLLGQVGITINQDNTLSLDKEAFLKADMSRVESLFGSTGSYGYSVSASASMINYNADYALSKADTYTFNGSYNSAYNTGALFNSYF